MPYVVEASLIAGPRFAAVLDVALDTTHNPSPIIPASPSNTSAAPDKLN